MTNTRTNNVLNKFEYLGKKNNDKKPTFETKPIDMAQMRVEKIDSKTYKIVKNKVK